MGDRLRRRKKGEQVIILNWCQFLLLLDFVEWLIIEVGGEGVELSDFILVGIILWQGLVVGIFDVSL